MSAATRTKEQSWLKENYEKIAVVVVLVALLGSSLYLLKRINEEKNSLARASRTQSNMQPLRYQPRDLQPYQEFVQLLDTPPAIQERESGFLVSELRVLSVNPNIPTPIPYDAPLCPWTGFEQPTQADRDTTGDGIPDEWLLMYGLNHIDPRVGDQDPDGDGFTVREEFEAGTSPSDASDHPSHAYKLRWRQIREIPFQLRFQGVNEVAEGVYLFQLNLRDGGRTYNVRLGEVVQGYKLVDYDRRRAPVPGSQVTGATVDASVLTMERADGRRIELIINRDYRVDERVAELVFLVDDSIHRVREGSALSLMGLPYKVVDINADSVIVRDEERDQSVTVGQEEVRVPQADPDQFEFFGEMDAREFEEALEAFE
jgi:hypothetical protein